MRRLASPELGPCVRELWQKEQQNPEVRDVLVDMMWHGRLTDCADLAEATALDNEEDEHIRTAAARALLACDHSEKVQHFVDDVLVHIDRWHGRSFYFLFPDMVPHFLSVEKFVDLLRRLISGRNGRIDVEVSVGQVIEKIDIRSRNATKLRDRLSELIESGKPENIQPYAMKSRYAQLSDVLANLCARQIETDLEPEADLIQACVVAARFKSDFYSRGDGLQCLKDAVANRPQYRKAIYWADVSFLGALFPDKDVSWCARRSVGGDALLQSISVDDQPWLEKALRKGEGERRKIALFQLLRLWVDGQRPQWRLQQVCAMVSDDLSLVHIVDQAAQPVQDSPKIKEMKEGDERRRQKQEAQERERKENWRNWRDTICANPVEAFRGEGKEVNIVN